MTEELTKAAQQALEALEEARDEVEAAKQQAAQLAGYPRTDARHASYVAQLEKHDAAIDALRSALTQRPAAQTEREAFEAEMRCEETWGHRSLKKRPDGRYQNWQVDVMWDVWQRRAALPAPQQATPATACGKGCACLTQCGDYYDHHGQATPEPSRRPLFAASVAARKWAELQEQGHRMQSLQFDGGPGGSGSIDPWGQVMWATPEPVGEPISVAAVATVKREKLDWLIEGGIAALPDGAVLLVADSPITDDLGGGEVYTRPAPAAQSAQVPEGWKLVPVEPTVEMALAGADVIRNRARGKFVRYVMHDVWAAMLAAAPQGAGHG